MAPRGDKRNRIEVDLKLFQNKELERLEKVVDGLRQAAERLADSSGTPGSGAQQAFSRAANAGRPGKPSPHASFASGREDLYKIGIARDSSGREYLDPKFKHTNRLGRLGYGPGSISEYEQAQFSLGMLGQGKGAAAMYISHMLQKYARNENPATGEITLSGKTGAKGAELVGGVIGSYARMQPYTAAVMRGISRSMNYFGMGDNMTTQAGIEAGYDRGGFGGLFGPAFRAGAGMNWRAALASGFGFGGFGGFGLKDAGEAMAAMNAYGWANTSREGDYMNAMKTLKQHMGIRPRDSMVLLDQATRFGQSSIREFTQTMLNLREAARSANMSVTAFTTAVTSVAQQMNSQTGITMNNAINTVGAASAATGLNPADLGQMMADRNLSFIAASLGNPRNGFYTNYQAGLTGQHAASLRLQGGEVMFRSLMGMSYSDVRQIIKQSQTDPAAREKLNYLRTMWDQMGLSNMVMPGANFQKFINVIARDGVVKNTAVRETLGSFRQWASDKSDPNKPINMEKSENYLLDLARQGGLSGKDLDSYQQYLRNSVIDIAAKKMMGVYSEGGLDSANRHALVKQADRLSQLLKDKQQAVEKEAQKTVWIAMNPEIIDFFRLQGPTIDKSNTKGSFSRKAVTAGVTSLAVG